MRLLGVDDGPDDVVASVGSDASSATSRASLFQRRPRAPSSHDIKNNLEAYWKPEYAGALWSRSVGPSKYFLAIGEKSPWVRLRRQLMAAVMLSAMIKDVRAQRQDPDEGGDQEPVSTQTVRVALAAPAAIAPRFYARVMATLPSMGGPSPIVNDFGPADTARFIEAQWLVTAACSPPALRELLSAAKGDDSPKLLNSPQHSSFSVVRRVETPTFRARLVFDRPQPPRHYTDALLPAHICGPVLALLSGRQEAAFRLRPASRLNASGGTCLPLSGLYPLEVDEVAMRAGLDDYSRRLADATARFPASKPLAPDGAHAVAAAVATLAARSPRMTALSATAELLAKGAAELKTTQVVFTHDVGALIAESVGDGEQGEAWGTDAALANIIRRLRIYGPAPAGRTPTPFTAGAASVLQRLGFHFGSWQRAINGLATAVIGGAAGMDMEAEECTLQQLRRHAPMLAEALCADKEFWADVVELGDDEELAAARVKLVAFLKSLRGPEAEASDAEAPADPLAMAPSQAPTQPMATAAFLDAEPEAEAAGDLESTMDIVEPQEQTKDADGSQSVEDMAAPASEHVTDDLGSCRVPVPSYGLEPMGFDMTNEAEAAELPAEPVAVAEESDAKPTASEGDDKPPADEPPADGSDEDEEQSGADLDDETEAAIEAAHEAMAEAAVEAANRAVAESSEQEDAEGSNSIDDEDTAEGDASDAASSDDGEAEAHKQAEADAQAEENDGAEADDEAEVDVEEDAAAEAGSATEEKSGRPEAQAGAQESAARDALDEAESTQDVCGLGMITGGLRPQGVTNGVICGGRGAGAGEPQEPEETEEEAAERAAAEAEASAAAKAEAEAAAAAADEAAVEAAAEAAHLALVALAEKEAAAKSESNDDGSSAGSSGESSDDESDDEGEDGEATAVTDEAQADEHQDEQDEEDDEDEGDDEFDDHVHIVSGGDSPLAAERQVSAGRTRLGAAADQGSPAESSDEGVAEPEAGVDPSAVAEAALEIHLCAAIGALTDSTHRAADAIMRGNWVETHSEAPIGRMAVLAAAQPDLIHLSKTRLRDYLARALERDDLRGLKRMKLTGGAVDLSMSASVHGTLRDLKEDLDNQDARLRRMIMTGDPAGPATIQTTFISLVDVMLADLRLA